MEEQGKMERFEYTDRETVIGEVSRATGVLMALYAMVHDMMENDHIDWNGEQLNKLMCDTLDGLTRIADYHREW